MNSFQKIEGLKIHTAIERLVHQDKHIFVKKDQLKTEKNEKFKLAEEAKPLKQKTRGIGVRQRE